MSSEAITLVDAIVAELNTTTSPFVFSFKAVRRMAPFASVELDELKDLNVLAFVGSSRRERSTRNKFSRYYKPVIAIQRRLDGLDDSSRTAHADQLTELVEQIEDALEGKDLGGMSFIGFDTEQDREAFNAAAMQAISFFSTAIIPEYQSKS